MTTISHPQTPNGLARAALYYALVAVALAAAAIGAVGAQHGLAARDARDVALGAGLALAGAAVATHAPAWYWRAPRRRTCRSAGAAADAALAAAALLAAAFAAAGGVGAFAAATVAAGCAAASALAILAAARAADHPTYCRCDDSLPGHQCDEPLLDDHPPAWSPAAVAI